MTTRGRIILSELSRQPGGMYTEILAGYVPCSLGDAVVELLRLERAGLVAPVETQWSGLLGMCWRPVWGA